MELSIRARKHIERLDIVVKAAEVKWGVPLQLEQLVPPEMAAKFGRQWDALSAAITSGNYEDMIELADGAIRGVWAMDKAALDAGNVPATPSPIGAKNDFVPEAAKVEETIKPLSKEFWDQGGDVIDF